MITSLAELRLALESLSWADWFEIGQFVYWLGEQFFGLPDPMEELFSLFAGRPTMAASIEIARILHNYSSPTLQMLAAGAANSVQHGVPLSSSSGDPYFGPYYEAALRIEQGIRWSRTDSSTIAVENHTLSQVLYEAGNSNVTGLPTVWAVQQAWNLLKVGRPLGGFSPQPYFSELGNTGNLDKASQLAKGFSQQYLHPTRPTTTPRPPGGTTTPRPPAPTTTPPPPGGTTTPRPGAPTPSLTWSLPQNVTVAGNFAVSVTVEGGPFPTAQLYLYRDGEILQTEPAETTSATVPLTIPFTIPVQNLDDGLHALQAFWLGQHGAVHAEGILHWRLERQPGTTTPPPHGTTTPRPTTPPPTTTPPATTTPVPCHISINVNNGEIIGGQVALTAVVSGGPHPQAKLSWALGSRDIATIPAGTTNGHTPLRLTVPWDSSNVPDGTGRLVASWEHHDGSIICSISALVTILNHGNHTTPPPGGTTTPPPLPPPTTWEICCQEIVAALTRIANEIDKIGGSTEIAGIVDQLKNLVTELGKTGNIPETLLKIYDEQVKHDKDSLASREVLYHMVQKGMLDPELGQLFGDPVVLSIGGNPSLTAVVNWLGGKGIIRIHSDTDWTNSIIRWLKQMLNWLEHEALNFFEGSINGAIKLGRDLEPAFARLWNESSKIETLLPKAVFDAIVSNVFDGTETTADNVEEKAFKLQGSAFMTGQILHLLADVAGLIKYPVSAVWTHNAKMMVEMLAYKEILHSVHGAFFPEAITERARQRYRRQFRAHIPSYTEAHHGFARGKLDGHTRNSLEAFAGLDSKYAPFLQSLAYRPVSAFLLSRGFRNHAPPPDELQAVIVDQGVDPRFQHLIEQIVDDSCYQHLYDQFATSSLEACTAGAITLQELDDNLRVSNWDAKARNLARQTALLQRQTQIAKQTETAASTELAAGFITQAQAQSLMAAAGIDQWRIDTTTAIANARAALVAERRIQTEEQRLMKQGLAASFKSLLQQFQSGELGEVGLIASLEATLATYLLEYKASGATEADIEQAARFGEAEIFALVAQAKAKADGSQVLKYGVLMTRAEGQLLDARVAAIKEAVIRLDESLPNARNRLHGLGIPESFINALIERWDAQIQAKGAAPP